MPRRYRLRRRTFSTVIRPTPPTTYGAAACARSRARRLASWIGAFRARSPCRPGAPAPLVASARLRSVSAHARRFLLDHLDRRHGLDDRLVGRRHARLLDGAHGRAGEHQRDEQEHAARRSGAAAQQGHDERQRGDRGEQEREQRRAARTGSRWRSAPPPCACILIFAVTSVLASSISEWISAATSSRSLRKQVLDSVGREHEP